MIGFIIIVVLGALAYGVYFMLRTGASAAHVEVPDEPHVAETDAAAVRRSRQNRDADGNGRAPGGS